jgi:predicted PurR-regulated permease PerM
MGRSGQTGSLMPRRISLYVLLGTSLVIGTLFYQVIRPFLFALLFATVLAVLFKPVHTWATRRLGYRPRIAAAGLTSFILFLILLPLSGALVVAGVQLLDVSKHVQQMLEHPQNSDLANKIEDLEQSKFARTITRYYNRLSLDHQSRLKALSSRATDGFIQSVYDNTVSLMGNVVSFVIGLVVMGLAIYYLFADGDAILRNFKRLLPLEEKEEDAIIDQFGKVCRGVIAGTVIAALIQAGLAGVGYELAGVPNVLLLTAATMFFAFIPYIGAGSVMTVVAAWLALEERYWAAALLFLYGMTVVATCDNLIRAYVIGGQAKMNPLVAFITVLGGVQLVGLWGIFVGPMIAALFYTVLKLLHDRIDDRPELVTSPRAKVLRTDERELHLLADQPHL